ncbi:MAG: hypothetical protein ACRC10_03230 [Thermoguttaceae bacterium]
MKLFNPFFVILLLIFVSCPTFAQEEPQEQRPDENVYKGELVAFPGPWSFSIPKVSIILTSDEDLEILSSDPDRVIDMSLTFDKDMSSLRAKCEAAKNMGCRTLIVAFDHFFQQYRPGQDTERRLMPDMDEYIEKMAKIAQFAEQYGLGLELSLLTPLEIGRAYRRDTGECGVWMQYRKGLRDPKTGSFSVELWRQNRWANNKGVFDIEDAGVRVFAFKEAGIPGTPYRAVNERNIVEIKDGIQVEVLGEPDANYPGTRIRVFGKTPLAQEGLNRVLIVQSYKTPEMDYFSDEAGKYLKKLVDRYADAGIRLNALYSDEPHLMGDWGYHNHHDHGQFTLRYVSPGFADKFAKKFGEKYRDFAKYLVYFTYGQEDFSHDLSATEGIMHTFGTSPVEVRQTALFRAQYYRFLQDGLTDLLVDAKHHAERRMGQRLESRAHATWAESPTCDAWLRSQGVPGNAQKYEYTSDFIWSNTVQQSAVACSDYFRWGDFLTGNGNDHAEGGYLDRNYYGLALACSTGILNEIPFSYGAHWGMPDPIAHRRHLVAQTFGALQSVASDVQDFQHRDVDVLMLYPLDLVAVDEQFGSWTNQYGYSNYITQQKLVQLGTVNNGAIELAGRRFTTLVATFEPFPDPKLLSMMQQLVEQGGKVIWSGPVPLLTSDGKDAYAAWTTLFGVEYAPIVNEGIPLPGRQINFRGSFQRIAPQMILSHFLVDHVYTVADSRETEVVATIGDRIVGTVRHFPNGGSATFLGFRPLDNQACSLGYDTRTWFDILTALGVYDPSGRFLLDDNQTVLNDNTEFLSRTGDYIVCRFPNGTISVAPHLKNLEENWDGGFARNQERDAEVMKGVVLPSDQVKLNDFKVNGHSVDFEGTNFLSFRLDPEKNLLAFAGQYMKQITVDGKTFTFADEPIPLLMFAPVPQERQIPNGAIFEIQVHGTMPVRIPASGLPQSVKVFANGATLGSKGHEVPVELKDGQLHLNVTPNESGRTLWVVPN